MKTKTNNMEHITYIISIIVLFTACKQKASEAATEVTTETTTTQGATDSTSVAANELTVTEPAKLELTPLEDNGDLIAGENYTFIQNGKILIEFTQAIGSETKINGKIIINGKTYKLNKSVRIGDGGYTITGEGVVINIPKTTWKGDDDGGDCQEGKAPTIKISLDNQELELKNIKLDYCVFG